MKRYSRITNKYFREKVFLYAFPCVWEKCTICIYKDKNELKENTINKLNYEILNSVTGEFGVLEIINYGSCFEFPRETLKYIKEVIEKKGIKKLILKSQWNYKERLNEMKEYFQIPIMFKIGIDTFDNEFRNNNLNKVHTFNDPKEVSKYFEAISFIVGMKGQTKAMVSKDISFILQYFKFASINILTGLQYKVEKDDSLIKWFVREYSILEEHPNIEVIYDESDNCINI